MAQDGIAPVSINGESVPAVLFEGYTQTYQHRLCTPTSDDRVREDIVMSVLLIREGQRRGITIQGADDYGVKRATEQLERLPTDAPSERRYRFSWELQRQLSDAYRRALVGRMDEAALLERYRQAIQQRHPELVDLPLLRLTTYELRDNVEREAIRESIDSGASIAQLQREGRLGTFDMHSHEEWTPEDVSGYLTAEQAAKLQAGDIVYPESRDSVIIYVHETKVLSRVRPFSPIAGDDKYAMRIVRRLHYRERLFELESSLRQAAQVEQGGTLVQAPLTYPDCTE